MNLYKQYDGIVALRGITFTVNQGDIFGFIGPNGAGKTTALRILATLLEPSRGHAWIDGVSVIREPLKVRRVLGYMPDTFDVYPTLTVEEYLDFFAALHGIPRLQRGAVLQMVMELTELKNLKERLGSSLSRGMKQRLCMAKTLVHDPKVLILDEPTANLDPRARIEFRALLKELQRMGKTILISSHILSELAEVCNAVAIIEKGAILKWGRVDEIMQSLSTGRRLRIEVLDRVADAAEIVRRFPGTVRCETEGQGIRIDFRGEREMVAKLVRELVLLDYGVVSVAEEKVDLEEIFLRVTKGEVS